MRSVLLVILAVANLSAVQKNDPPHQANYAVSIDQVSLTVRIPTHSERGKPIIVSVALRNDSDKAFTYIGYPGAPFYITVCDRRGKEMYRADVGPQDSSPADLEVHGTLTHEYDLSKALTEAGTYTVNVARPLNERGDDWVDLGLRSMAVYVGKPDNPFFQNN